MKLPSPAVGLPYYYGRLDCVLRRHAVSRGFYRIGVSWEDLVNRHAVVLSFAREHTHDVERLSACRAIRALTGGNTTYWHVPWSW